MKFFPPIRPWFVRLRLPLILLPFCIILYFMIFALLLPFIGFNFEHRSTGEIVVRDVVINSPAAKVLRDGDVILAVDGQLTTQQADWQWVFHPRRPTYTYIVHRSDKTFSAVVQVRDFDAAVFVRRIEPFIIAFALWLIGALMLLLAKPSNKVAWRVGIVNIAFALILAANLGMSYFVPGGALTYKILTPFVGVAFAELALMFSENSSNNLERLCLLVGNFFAIVLALYGLIDVLLLSPTGIYLNVGEIGVGHIRLLHLSFYLLLNPITLSIHFWQTPRSYQKQQMRILLACTMVAVVPMVVAVFLPAIANIPIVPYQIPVFMLILLPGSYAYLIYRHKFLNLDLILTQGIAVFIVSFAFLILYALFISAVRRSLVVSQLEPLPSALFAAFAVVIFPATNRQTHLATQTLFYGQRAPYEQLVNRVVNIAATDPASESLHSIVQECADMLDVPQTALLLLTHKQSYECVYARQVHVENILLSEKIIPPMVVVRGHHLENIAGRENNHVVLERHLWAEVLAPLKTREGVIGLLMLGERVPDGTLNSDQVKFIEQFSNVLAVAAQVIQLFEASREMSRQLMRVRETERTALSAQIHDHPLHLVAATANQISIIEHRLRELDPGLSETLKKQAEALRMAAINLREICSGLRPPVLSQGAHPQFIIGEVEQRFKLIADTIVHSTVIAEDEVALDDDVTTALYHIASEALNNIANHSKAKNVWITLEATNGRLQLSVADDGRGMNTDAVSLAALLRSGHFGLVGMHEMANISGGRLILDQRPGGGTVVNFVCDGHSNGD